MSLIPQVKSRIGADHLQLAITTLEHNKYLKIAGYLGDSPATTTWMVSVMLRNSCQETRNNLRRMEKMGYVIADSNGSNSIRWRLKP